MATGVTKSAPSLDAQDFLSGWQPVDYLRKASCHCGSGIRMSDDPFDLMRFVEAQKGAYPHALREIQAGEKVTHWMWYIFPQLEGLGHSSMSRRYGIKNLAEAAAYLAHPVLGARLMECTEAALAVEGKSANSIFGSPDDLKLHSCATLFSSVSANGSVFHRLLEKYFDGEGDENTRRLLGLR